MNPLLAGGFSASRPQYGDLQSVENSHRVRSSPTECLIQGVCGRLVKTLIQVPVDVQCGLDRSVTEAFLDHLRMGALCNQHDGVAVAEVVEPARLSRRCTHGGLPDTLADPLGPPPPSSDVAARVAWQIAKRQAERDETERQTPSLDLAASR